MRRKWQKKKQAYLLALFACIIPITTIAFTYGALKTANPTDTISRGIAGDTVYIDDSMSDYYYYTGQNYTNSDNGSLPTLSNKNIYGDATIETSSGNGTYESWDGETSYYVTARSPFFLRGGAFSEGEFSGLFSYSVHSGHSGGDHGFRCSLIVE